MERRIPSGDIARIEAVDQRFQNLGGRLRRSAVA